MSLNNTWREVAINNASGAQKAMVDYTTEDAPLFASVPTEPTSDGLQDVYEVLTSADFIPNQELDAPLQMVDTATRLEQTNLGNWACKIEVGEDKLMTMKMSDDAYYAMKTPEILRQTGGKLSRTVYDQLKAYAYNNQTVEGIADRVILAGGAGANDNYSISAVKWVGGQTTGLYNAGGWGNGKVFDVKKLYGGDLGLNSEGVACYSSRIKLNSGLKLANPRYVTSLVNITADGNLATMGLDDKISQMIEEARGADVLYMHPTLKRLIGSAFKLEKIQLVNADRDINSLVDSWDGVPIITDYNLLKGTEALVTL